ncbi:hypothetical protein [Listeria fleischmannii]|uniref:Acetyltransferase n=1 Tax=Listeria fleischmannii FSL S10-1203 TaxID=1265822 RepID=W7DCM9_9LIST|nr:hypothetical protein [Listeria fleischmannii]EUJ47042.1 acetyltransferase [Listeria fleischmannii FSL S10-1203]
MIQYRNLLGVSVTTIYETFLDAFSDYAIPMKPSLATFQNMLVSKGFQADSSVGAFDQSDLVGFILNGERETQVYNLGTGVKVAYRAQKIASGMLDASIRLLFEKKSDGLRARSFARQSEGLRALQAKKFRNHPPFSMLSLRGAPNIPKTIA